MPRGHHPMAGFLQQYNPHDMPPIMNQHNAPIGVMHSQEPFSSNMHHPNYPFNMEGTRNHFETAPRPVIVHSSPPNPVSSPDMVINNGLRFIMMRDAHGVPYHQPYIPPSMQIYPDHPHHNVMPPEMNASSRSQPAFQHRGNLVPPNERGANENIPQSYLPPTYLNSPQYRPHPPPNSSFPRCNNSLGPSELSSAYPYDMPFSSLSRLPSNSQSFHHAPHPSQHHPQQQSSPSDSNEPIYFLPDFLNQEINNVPQGFAAAPDMLSEERHQSSSSHYNSPPAFHSQYQQAPPHANNMRDYLRLNAEAHYAANMGAQHPQQQPAPQQPASSHHQGPSSGNPLGIFQASPESLEFWRPGYRQSAMNNLNRGPACPTHATFLSRYMPTGPPWYERERWTNQFPLNTYIERLIQRDIDSIFRTSHHGNLSRQSETEAREELSRFLTEVKGTENEDCCICTDNGESLWKLPCDHNFHKECLLKWLVNRRTCPLCRTVY